MPDRVMDLARKIRLLVLDVDGVLTDGGLYYDANGLAMKRFHVHDGFGIKLAQSVGIEVGVITGLDQPPVAARVRELGITHYSPGNHDKLPHFLDMCQKAGVQPSEAAFMGDDWIDLTVMRAAGLAMAVPDAMPEVLAAAHWVSTCKGGHGAVREAVSFIMRARGLEDDALKQWIK
jgi:3-deoxy-D-manno-octulosonate 8-phosphate phosphatase (KDO 8-P phosphatase)